MSGHYFEIGWDGWVDGGSDVARYQGTMSPEGQFSIRIRDNSNEQSATTSSIYNLSAYNSVTVSFQFRAEGMENGEDFWLRYYNGSTWNTLASFVAGTQFVNNQLYTVTITTTGALSNVARFRFQCDASENDDMIYIDAVVISASSGSNIVESPVDIKLIPNSTASSELKEEVMIYPNPTLDLISVTSAENIKNIKIFSTTGQIMLYSDTNFSHIEVSGLHSGMYILHIETEENLYVKKLVKK